MIKLKTGVLIASMLLLCLAFVNAQTPFSDCTVYGNCKVTSLLASNASGTCSCNINKTYVDATFVKKTGDTMSGSLFSPKYYITGAGNSNSLMWDGDLFEIYDEVNLVPLLGFNMFAQDGFIGNSIISTFRIYGDTITLPGASYGSSIGYAKITNGVLSVDPVVINSSFNQSLTDRLYVNRSGDWMSGPLYNTATIYSNIFASYTVTNVINMDADVTHNLQLSSENNGIDLFANGGNITALSTNKINIQAPVYTSSSVYTVGQISQNQGNPVNDRNTYFFDFTTASTTNTAPFGCAAINGAGTMGVESGGNANVGSSYNRIGVVNITAGANANTGFQCQIQSNALVLGGGEYYSIGYKPAPLPASNGTRTMFGFLDILTCIEPTNGVIFRVDNNTAYGAVYFIGNKTESSSYALSENGWYDFHFLIGSDQNRTTFWITNSSLDIVFNETVISQIANQTFVNLYNKGKNNAGFNVCGTSTGVNTRSVGSVDYVNIVLSDGYKRRLI